MADGTRTRRTTRQASSPAAGTAVAEEEVVEETLGAPRVPEGSDAEVAGLLAELRHRKGCPAKGSRLDAADARIEVVRHRVSGKGLDPDRGGNNDGLTAIVVRCVECGAQEPE